MIDVFISCTILFIPSQQYGGVVLYHLYSSSSNYIEILFFTSQVDQMVIHCASDPQPRSTLCSDYFYNYYSRGLDILFDGKVN